jgi:hypothetical protein
MHPARPLDMQSYISGVLVLCNDEGETGLDEILFLNQALLSFRQ